MQAPYCDIRDIRVNDLLETCKDLLTTTYLYADDNKLYKQVCNTEDSDILQNVMANKVVSQKNLAPRHPPLYPEAWWTLKNFTLA